MWGRFLPGRSDGGGAAAKDTTSAPARSVVPTDATRTIVP